MFDSKDPVEVFFSPTRPADSPAPTDEEIRSQILTALSRPDWVAVKGKDVLVKTEIGACLVRVKDEDVVQFHFRAGRTSVVPNVRFLMNASSVRDLGRALAASPNRRGFGDLFLEISSLPRSTRTW